MNRIVFQEKTYRKIVVDNTEYVGRDGFKNRTPNYVLDIFPNDYFVNKKILDVGCASGAILFSVAEKGIERGVGVDVDDKKLNIGRKIKENHGIHVVEFVNTDILKFFRDYPENFDCIFLLNILHHLPNPFRVMDLAAEMSLEYLCLELPDEKWYHPYSRDKHKKVFFNRPLDASDVILYFEERDFSCIKTVKNQQKEMIFKKSRQVYLLKKNKIKFITYNDVDLSQFSLIVGPGASGKTTFFEKLGLKTLDENGGRFKYRDNRSHKKHQDSFSIFSRKVAAFIRNKHRYRFEKPINTFSDAQKILYLNPNYAQTIYNSSIRGVEINTHAWIEISKKYHATLLICYVPRTVLIDRLTKRLKERFLKQYLVEREILSLIDVLENYEIHASQIDKRVKIFLRSIGKEHYFQQIKKSCQFQFCANSAFSYPHVFHRLKKNKVPFVVIATQ